MANVIDPMRDLRLVAIIRGVPEAKAEPLAGALIEGGVKAIEVTFNTPGAARIIGALKGRFGSSVAVGAGTVLTLQDVLAARDAGAEFILAPDVNVEVIRATKAAGLVSVPGAMTPTEVVAAHRAGADVIKIFPAGSLGPGYIKNLLGPLDWGRFMVVGGVDVGNLAGFFQAGAVSAGVGGCLVKKDLIEAGDWPALAKLAAQFAAIAKEA